MLMKLSLAAALGAAVIAFAPLAQAEISDKTQEFARKASMGNRFEVMSSEIALKRSQSAEVKSFAQQMIDDHTAARTELASILGSEQIEGIAKDTLDEKHQNILNELQREDAEDFDEEYLESQVAAHNNAVSLFEDYADDGDHEKLRAFAAKTLPTLKQHQQHANDLEKAN